MHFSHWSHKDTKVLTHFVPLVTSLPQLGFDALQITARTLQLAYKALCPQLPTLFHCLLVTQ